MKKAFFVLIILIIFLMALQNWEGLQKSATDDETIEQAIARLIAVHEADSESHLGVGESLAAHKASDVIDHPAGSVVADKFSMTEYQFVPSLLPYGTDSFFVGTDTGGGFWDSSNGPAVSVNVFDSAGSSVILGNIMGQSEFSDYTKDTLIEFNFLINEHGNYKAYLTFGYVPSGTPSYGFGFEIDDDVLKGYYVNTSGIQRTASLTWSLSTLTNLRAFFKASEDTIYFFINGVEVASLAVSSPAGTTQDSRISIGAYSKTSSPDIALWIFNVFFSRSLI